MQVLTDSNLSILGDMVKSLSKRAIKQQSSVEQLTQEVTQCKGEPLHRRMQRTHLTLTLSLLRQTNARRLGS